MKLDQVGLTDQIQPITPHRQGSLHAHARFDFTAGRINQMMQCLSTRGMDMVLERLLQMNQAALARTVHPVLKGRQRNGVCLGHVRSATIFKRRLFPGGIMAALLKELENQALQLNPRERGELIHRLIVSLEGPPAETPEAIAQAWDEEIARRVADMEAGRTPWLPADEAMSRIRAKISAAKATAANAD